MKPYRFLLGLAVLSVSVLLSAVETNAQSKLGQSTQNAAGNRMVRIEKQQLQRTARRLGLRANAIRSSKNAQFAKLATRCVCAVPDDDLEAFGNCFKNCLKSWGISASSVSACGAVCTGNYVGCAVCAGVQEWVVLGCAQYCVWRNVLSSDGGAVSKHRPRQRQPRANDQVRV